MDEAESTSLQDLSDEQLVEWYREGHDEAFTVLLERYRRELFHFLVRFVSKPAAADDVFQEAFLQVHTSLDRFDASRRFKPWLFTIAANKARDWLRRNRQTPASLSAPVAGGAEGAPTAFVDLMESDFELPSDVAQNQEVRGLVQEVVASLPDHLREVLLLAYFHRLAYRDIAEMLGIPLGTVKSRLHAAVGTFAQLWRQRYGDLS